MLYIFNFPAPESPIEIFSVYNIRLEKVTDTTEIEILNRTFRQYKRLPGASEIDLERVVRVSFDGGEPLSVLREQWLSDEWQAEIILRKNEVKNLMNALIFGLPDWDFYLAPLVELSYLVDLGNIHSTQVHHLETLDILNEVVDSEQKSEIESQTADNYRKLVNSIKRQKFLLEQHTISDSYSKNSISLHHIGESLELYKLAWDPKIQFWILIWIIEDLLCKGRDDLTRQFCFKLAIAIERIQMCTNFDKIHQWESTPIFFHEIYVKIQDLPKLLPIIYEIRSKIVHWKQREIDDSIKKFAKVRKVQLAEISFDGTVFSFLKSITSALLHLTIQQPDFIGLLRDGWVEKS